MHTVISTTGDWTSEHRMQSRNSTSEPPVHIVHNSSKCIYIYDYTICVSKKITMNNLAKVFSLVVKANVLFPMEKYSARVLFAVHAWKRMIHTIYLQTFWLSHMMARPGYRLFSNWCSWWRDCHWSVLAKPCSIQGSRFQPVLSNEIIFNLFYIKFTPCFEDLERSTVNWLQGVGLG